MSVTCPPRRAPRVARERGQAMLLTVLLLGVGVVAIVYNFSTPAKQAVERDRITAAALADARSALIGYAAANQTQPGVLPCPDNDNDGSADAPCGASGTTAIGRLPWRTLGVPPLRDGMGECLWYAVSGNFKNSGVSGPAIVNSDSVGTLVVNDASGAAILSGSNAALAIVFAPGAPLPTQDRTPAGPSVCGGNNNPASYLDTRTIGGTTFDNATGGGGTSNFVIAATTPGPTELNDKLMPITRDAVFPVVEMRVAREVRLRLRSYFNDPPGTPRQYYPFAAQFPANTATSGTYSGYVPTNSVGCSALPDLASYLPAWFTVNSWHQFVVYAVAPQCTPKLNTTFQTLTPTEPTPACAMQPCPPPGTFRTCQIVVSIDASASDCNNTTAGGLLTVSGDATVRAIVMPASYRLGAQVRPCTAIADCLEPVGASNENINGDNVYVRPARSATNNDSLVVVAPPP